MALSIFSSMKRFSSPLNCVRLHSKYFSHASFAVADESKQIPTVRIGRIRFRNQFENYLFSKNITSNCNAFQFQILIEENNKHDKNKELLWKNSLKYANTVECVKLQENVVSYSEVNLGSSSDGSSSNPNQCSDEQLSLVFENLREYLPKLFVTVMDYTIYHPQLIFENNIQGKRTV